MQNFYSKLNLKSVATSFTFVVALFFAANVHAQQIVVGATGTDATSCNAGNGDIAINPSGGDGNNYYDIIITGPENFSFYGVSSADAAGQASVLPGIYTVYVYDDLDNNDGYANSQSVTVLNGPSVGMPEIVLGSDVYALDESDGSLCSGSTKTFAEQSNSFSSYSWNLSYENISWTGNSVAQTITSPPGTTDVVSIIAIDGSGCNWVGSYSFTILTCAQISVNATGTDAACNDNTGSITVIPTGGDSADVNDILYNIYLTGPSNQQTSIVPYVTFSDLPPGDYTVSVYDADDDPNGGNGGGTYSNSQIITIGSVGGAPPVINLTNALCAYDTTTFYEASGPGAYATYSWSTDAPIGGNFYPLPYSTDYQQAIYFSYYVGNGYPGANVYLTVTDGSGCVSSTSYAITVTNVATFNNDIYVNGYNLDIDQPTLCAGSVTNFSTDYQNSNGTPFVSYNWSLDGNQYMVDGQNSNSVHYTIQSSPNPDYISITVTDANGCTAAWTGYPFYPESCSQIAVNATPSDLTGCNTGDGQVSGTPSGGAGQSNRVYDVYLYNSGNTLVTSQLGVGAYDFMGLNPDTYSVQVYDATGDPLNAGTDDGQGNSQGSLTVNNGTCGDPGISASINTNYATTPCSTDGSFTVTMVSGGNVTGSYEIDIDGTYYGTFSSTDLPKTYGSFLSGSSPDVVIHDAGDPNNGNYDQYDNGSQYIGYNYSNCNQIVLTVTKTDETCVEYNGTITVSATGGDGSSYYYVSIYNNWTGTSSQGAYTDGSPYTFGGIHTGPFTINVYDANNFGDGLYNTAYAQINNVCDGGTCTFPIPSNTDIFSGSGNSINCFNAYTWLCAGATLAKNGGCGGGTIFVEPGATLIFNNGGASDAVYLKGNSTLICYQGGPIVVYADPTATVNNQGTNAVPIICNVQFDYTNAPTGGCGTSPLSISNVIVTPATCGNSDGSIEVVFSGGDGNIDGVISNGSGPYAEASNWHGSPDHYSTGPNGGILFSAIPGGNWNIHLSDQSGNTLDYAGNPVAVGNGCAASQIVVNATPTDLTGCNDNSGTIYVAPTGGDGTGYNIILYDNGGNPISEQDNVLSYTFSSLYNGNYFVYAEDNDNPSDGWATYQYGVLIHNSNICSNHTQITSVITYNNETCPGSNNASIVVNASGGDGFNNYDVSVYGGANSQWYYVTASNNNIITFSGLPTGTYSDIYIYDDNDPNDGYADFEYPNYPIGDNYVTCPSQIAATVYATNINCWNGDQATISVVPYTATGGDGSGTYNIYVDGTFQANFGNGGWMNFPFSAGSHDVLVTDGDDNQNNNNGDAYATTVNISDVGCPTLISATVGATPAGCSGNETIYITPGSVSGGDDYGDVGNGELYNVYVVAPDNYSQYGAYDFPGAYAGSFYGNLGWSGSYPVNVTEVFGNGYYLAITDGDDNGNNDNGDAFVDNSVPINSVSCTQITVNASPSDLTGCNTGDGQVTVTPFGGDGQSNGVYDIYLYNSGSGLVASQLGVTTYIFTGLNPDTYSVQVYDATGDPLNGGTDDGEGNSQGGLTVNNGTCSGTLNASVTPAMPSSCGGSDGSITVSGVSGGDLGYPYVVHVYNTGTTTDAGNSPQNVDASTSAVITLLAGDYDVSITDNSGDVYSAPGTVVPVNSSCGGIQITSLTETDETCVEYDGTITISATGGDGSSYYTFSMYNNNTAYSTGGSAYNSITFTGLHTGDYTVYVQDANNPGDGFTATSSITVNNVCDGGTCTFAIPSSAEIFNGSTTGCTAYYWLCAGADVTAVCGGFGPGNGAVFLEPGSTFNSGGGGSFTVYLKGNSTFNSGGGGDMIVYADPAATVNYTGTVIRCNVQFDYTNAPAGGCVSTCNGHTFGDDGAYPPPTLTDGQGYGPPCVGYAPGYGIASPSYPGSYTYQWSTSDAAASGTLSSPTCACGTSVTWQTAGQQYVYVDVTDDNGCTAEGSQPITVGGFAVTILAENGSCNNYLSNYTTEGGPWATYSWSETTGNGSQTNGNSSDPFSVSWNQYGTTGDIEVTVTDGSGGCAGIGSLPVNLAPAPSATISYIDGYNYGSPNYVGVYDNIYICNSTFDFAPGDITNGSTYSWSLTDASGNQTGTTNPTSFTLTQPGNTDYISLSLTDGITGCTATQSNSIYVADCSISISASIGDVTCQADGGGNGGYLSGSATGGSGNYDFSCSCGQPDQLYSFDFTGLSAGDYTISVTDFGGGNWSGYAGTATFTVGYTNQSPYLPSISIPGPCVGSATFSENSGYSYLYSSYTWSADQNASVSSNSDASDQLVNLNSLGAADVYLTVTDVNGCTADTFVNFNIINAADGTIGGATSGACANLSLNEYYVTPGGSNYVWTTSGTDNVGTVVQGEGTNDVSVTWASDGYGGAGTGYLEVSFIDANGCAVDQGVQNISINEVPISNPNVGNTTTSVCTGTAYVYTSEDNPSTGQPYSSYIWTLDPGATILAGGGASDDYVSVSWASPETGSVSVAHDNGSGCSGNAGSISVDVTNCGSGLSVNVTNSGNNNVCPGGAYNGFITGTVTGESCSDQIDVSCGCGLPDQFIANGGTFDFEGIQSAFFTSITADDDCGDTEGSASYSIFDASQCYQLYINGAAGSDNTACTGYNGTITGAVIGASSSSAIVTVSCNGCGAPDYVGEYFSSLIFSFTGVQPGTWDITATDDVSDIAASANSGYDASITVNNDPNCGGNSWVGGHGTNDWSDDNNWSTGTAPTNDCAASVNIPSGNTTNEPVVTGNVSIGNVTMGTGAEIMVNGNLSVCGSITGGSAGTADAQVLGAGDLILSGTSTQTISGDISFNNLVINSGTGGSVALASNAKVDVYTALILEQGDINTAQGTLTFKSNSLTTSAIIDNFSSAAGNGQGTITGNITVERYYSTAALFGQHMIGTPVSGNNLSALGSANQSSAFITPTSNCDELHSASGTAYGNVFSYHESNGSACTMAEWKVEAAGNATQNGLGYSVILTHPGSTFSLTGTANLTPSYSVSGLTNSNWNNFSLQTRHFISGWSLLSNPYLAPLSAAGLVSDNSANFDMGILVWDNTTGSYQTATTIAPFQAFLVHRSAPDNVGATYIIKGSNRVTTAATFSRQENAQTLTLVATNVSTGLTDATTVGFDPNATGQFDPAYDFYKVPGDLSRHTLYTTFGPENLWMMRNVHPDISQTATVQVGLEPGVSSNYSFSFDGIGSFDPTSYITLEDTKLHVMHDARSGNYNFTADATNDSWTRFVLHFTPPAAITSRDADCNTTGFINISQPGTANWNYVVSDANNNTVATGTLNEANQVLLNVSVGVYTLTLKDNAGYTVVKSIQVGGSSAIVAEFTSSATSSQASQNIAFSSTTANASTFSWSFGDGAAATGQSVKHDYNLPGVYTVQLTVINASGCISTTTRVITVTSRSATGIPTSEDPRINIWSNTNLLYVDFTQLSEVQATIDVYNILGQQMFSDKYTGSTVYRKEIDNIEVGYIIVRVKNNDEIITKKVFISNDK